ncbi:sporulation protein YtxC [Lentibacillus saliphilus]|uniref:sporulation protein YtxC n=1 Tax=Lentibacillus saliphilus TaxID=2737028 RepID=UPI0031BA05E6
MLLEVYFESDQEVISFCECLFRHNKRIELTWGTNEEWGNRISFDDDMPTVERMDTVAKSMVDVFIHHRLSRMITDIIKSDYYYTSTVELERILALTHWIFAGEDEDSLRVRNYKDPTQVLKTIFMANMKQTEVIHFDSIVHFRLQVFKEQLVHYVGLAIDEFKREEEHQAFVNSLREYVIGKKTTYPVLHVVQGSRFTFFKPSGKQFSTMELRMMMHQEPLYIVGLDIDEFNLAPLIAMAPEKIRIYGDDPSEPKTLTVINVFQERAQFEPLENFPFTQELKK